MTDHKQSQRESTEQFQQTTMNQGQEAIVQAIDLQRNVARMTLSAMQWQETAQQQSLELTKSMLQGFPGQQFTRSIVQSYLQGLEAVMPEMERAVEKGMQAAAQPGMEMGQQMGGQQMGGRQMSGQQSGGRTGGQWNAQEAGGRMHGQQTGGRRMGGRQPGHSSQQTSGWGTTDSTRQSMQQSYPQTGEWVSPERTYGGESSGTMGQGRDQGQSQPQQSISSDQSDRYSQPPEYETRSQTGQAGADYESQGQSGYSSPPQGGRAETETQQGRRSAAPTQNRSETQGRHGWQDRGTQSSQHGRRDSQSRSSQQGQSRERYSQRIDSERHEGGRGRQRQSIAQGQGRQGEPPAGEFESSESDEFDSSDVDAEPDSDTDEMPQGDTELSAERSDAEADEGTDDESLEEEEE